MGERPNILMIVADQLRADCLGCYHGYPVQTPHLDRLAEKGMVFEQAYTPQPLCCPARQSILSSRRPERDGCLWNYGICLDTAYLKPAPGMWTNQLKKMGYHSHYIGKWHVSPEDTPLSFGYETFIDDVEYKEYRQEVFPGHVYENEFLGEVDMVPLEQSRTHWLAAKAVERLKQCTAREGPWHIRLDFPEPHLPCRPCREFYQWYQDAEIPKWRGFEETFVKKPYIQRQQVCTWGLEDMEWDQWKPVVTRYYAIISQMDDAIGRVLHALYESGQWENTLVIVTADHGDMCGSHRMLDKHYVLYDDVVHVPLLMAWPGRISSGMRGRELVCHALDLGPTLLELTGGEPVETDGRSLVPLLFGEKPKDWRREVVATYNGQQFGLYTQRMLRTPEWKYIWNTTDVDELYDMTQDKGELHNLIYEQQHQERIQYFRKRLLEILEREGDGLVKTQWMRDQLLGKTRKL